MQAACGVPLAAKGAPTTRPACQWQHLGFPTGRVHVLQSRNSREFSQASILSSSRISIQSRGTGASAEGGSVPQRRSFSLTSFLRTAVSSAGRFVQSCFGILGKLYILSPKEGMKRLVLILAASLLMIVVLTSIDSMLMLAHLLNSKKIA